MKINKNTKNGIISSVDTVKQQSQFDNSKYIRAFGWNDESPSESLIYQKDSRLAKAYEIALDIRKFEIELYWKRSSSFWLLITAISTALGVLASSNTPISSTSSILGTSQKEVGCLILSLAATLLCSAWWLVNKTSKFWQQNWESQVDILEQSLLGPLYKTVLLPEGEFKKTAYYSVSDINKETSLYMFWLFGFISLYFIGFFKNIVGDAELDLALSKCLILVINAVFVLRFLRKKSVKSNEAKNALDRSLEATIRNVSINQIIASKAGFEILEKPISYPENELNKSLIMSEFLEFCSECKKS